MRVLLALALTAPVAANWGQGLPANPSGTYQPLLAVLHSPGLELVVRARRLGLVPLVELVVHLCARHGDAGALHG